MKDKSGKVFTKQLGITSNYVGVYKWKNLVEKKYLKKLVKSIENKIEITEGVGLYIVSSKPYVGRVIEISELKQRITKDEKFFIVIYVSDESGRHPTDLMSENSVVFKSYIESEGEKPNLFHFPVGIANFEDAQNENSTDGKTLDLFFSGNMNEERKKLYQALDKSFIPSKTRLYVENLLSINPSIASHTFSNSNIRFYRRWGGGMDPSTYHSYLARSKIALCPPGFRTAETFRHFEALRAGCAVISERLPPSNPFYQTSAIIQVDSAREMVDKARELLSNERRLEHLMQLSRRWWERKCSPEAVAEYIYEKATSYYQAK